VTTKDRPLYAYRLVVEYPAGVDALNPPHLWLEDRSEEDTGEWYFGWPRDRRYLSYSGAKKRADLLRRYGCVVGIQRSERIEWTEP
jgi:hypothetical protein